MNYNLFDKRFLYVVPDADAKALVGKKVFWGDIIVPLIRGINAGIEHEGTLVGIRDTPAESAYPFEVRKSSACETVTAAYIYYDPYYNLKLAKAQGKTIQIRDFSGEWSNVKGSPSWTMDISSYRIKPEELWYAHTCGYDYVIDQHPEEGMHSASSYTECLEWVNEKMQELVTNRELAEWLAEGNGQVSSRASIACGLQWTYKFCEDDVKVLNEVLVRRWDDTEWHAPTRRYIYEHLQD